MIYARCILVVLLVSVVSASHAPGQTTGASAGPTHAFRVVTVAEGLVNPWSIAFLPSGDILVTERSGRLRIIRNGVLDPESIRGVPAVVARAQGGLLDIALHPDFVSNQWVYLSYTKPGPGGDWITEAIVRGRLVGSNLTDVQEIFEAKIRPGGNGVTAIASRLAFDRAGFLYFTIGDRQMPIPDQEAHVSQDLTTHMGKTIRIHDDGRAPSDNPFVGHPRALPEIWSYGHRNAQGMAFHPQTGELWQSESGAQGGDELNLIRAGRNYGWPVIGFGRQYSGAPAHQATAREGMEQPVHHWTTTLVPSGMTIYWGERFPNWKGSILIAGLGGERVSRVVVQGDRFVAEEPLLEGVLGRIRDVRESPDGFVYLAIDGGLQGLPSRIVRLEPM